MKEYLVEEKGVAAEHILLEPTAYHTLDNIIEAKDIMDCNNLQPKNLVIITHDWHMNRAKGLAPTTFQDTRISKRYVHLSSPLHLFSSSVPSFPPDLVKSGLLSLSSPRCYC
jgi:hypothetical protein